MSDEQNNFQSEGSPRWMGLAVVGLAILSLVGVGMAWNATNHAQDAEQALNAQSKTFQQSQDGITQRLAQAEQTNAQMQGEIEPGGRQAQADPRSTGNGPHPGKTDPRRLHEEANEMQTAVNSDAGDQGQHR